LTPVDCRGYAGYLLGIPYVCESNAIPTGKGTVNRLVQRNDRDGGEPLDNQRMFDQLTGPLSAEQWVYLRQKLGFYEHLVMQFFKDSHPDKIRRDNAIIWLMAEMMVSGLKGTEQGDKMEVVQQWAEGSRTT
jgi:hypothetical protein